MAQHHVFLRYLSHESEESGSQSDGAAGLFVVPHRGQSLSLQQSRPLVQGSLQRLAQLFKKNKHEIMFYKSTIPLSIPHT